MNGWRERCKKGRKEEKRRVATGSVTGNTQTLQQYLLERGEKQLLCACGERGFRHTRGREQSERWREKKWISAVVF
jgi:hypothetical protein